MSTICLMLLIVACHRASALCSISDVPSSLSADEIQHRLGVVHANTQQWLIEYEIAEPRKDGNAEATIAFVRMMAARPTDEFVMWSRRSGHGLAWAADPLQQRVIISPSRAVIEFPMSAAYRHVMLARDDPVPRNVSSDWLFIAYGWWPFVDRPAPRSWRNAPIVLRDIADSPHYIVWPQQQVIEGYWCHVFEHLGHDRLWIDTERYAAILRREILDGDMVLRRFELSSHREAYPNVWVPMTVRNVRLEPSSGKVVDEMTLQVRVVRVHEPLADELFSLANGCGDMELFSDGRWDGATPLSMGHLDVTANWLREQFADLGQDQSHASATITDLAISVVFIAASAWLARRLRKATSAAASCRASPETTTR